MKRGTFGVILLFVIFFASLTEQLALRTNLRPVLNQVDRASQAVLLEDYEKTAALAREARAAWEAYRLSFGALSQQQAVQEIDSLYEEAEVFLNAREKVHCSAVYAVLRNRLQALLEDQKLSLQNLL